MRALAMRIRRRRLLLHQLHLLTPRTHFPSDGGLRILHRLEEKARATTRRGRPPTQSSAAFAAVATVRAAAAAASKRRRARARADCRGTGDARRLAVAVLGHAAAPAHREGLP